jgi:hypothetical protein
MSWIGAPFKNYITDPERAEAAIKLVLSQEKVIAYELKQRYPTTPRPFTTGIEVAGRVRIFFPA